MNAQTVTSDSSTGRRRLATIAFADVVGYSLLMATDEKRTIAQWTVVLEEIIRPAAAEHHGSIVKLTGDGVLATFSSALEAVRWAQAVQAGVARRAGADGGSWISLRIAVHLSDVVEVQGDIHGDGVNVTARLQELANPGGIVISEAVHDLIRGGIAAPVIDLGLRQLKNFEKPVRAYALDPDVPTIRDRGRSRAGALPSIAVLPLENLGPDPADEYFSDGLVEDMIVSLAGLGELFVIARGSTLTFRGRRADPREVGQALGVRYVLLGSLRRLPRMIRVSMQLCDATTGADLWSETTDAPPGELFDLQDRIVARVVAGIAPNVRAAELRAALRKRPESFTAYDRTLRALHVMHQLDPGTYREARKLLDEAMGDDPSFAMPVAWAAWWHVLNVGQGWSIEPDQDVAQAGLLASRAIELDQRNALGLAIFGHAKSYLFHQHDVAALYLERALAACPNSSLAWLLSSATLAYIGRGEQAVQHAQHGLRLSPFDRSRFLSYNILCIAHYANGEHEEAIRWGRMSLAENPAFSATHRFLIGSLVETGQLDEARRLAAELMRLEPGFRLGVWERTRQPFRDAELRDRHVGRLRKVGLPE